MNLSEGKQEVHVLCFDQNTTKPSNKKQNKNFVHFISAVKKEMMEGKGTRKEKPSYAGT